MSSARGAGPGHRERGREARRFLVRGWGGRRVRADRDAGRRRGRLRVDSAPGQGTRITGTVPVVAAPSSGTVVAGQQGHEHLGVRAAPAGDRIPTRPGLVAGDGLRGEHHGVAARGDVAERLVVERAAAGPVDPLCQTPVRHEDEVNLCGQ